jgi:hypothetical protein
MTRPENLHTEPAPGFTPDIHCALVPRTDGVSPRFRNCHRLIAHAAALFFLCATGTDAAQPPVTYAVPQSRVSVAEDPGPWRRDPFIGSINKGGSPNGTGAVPLKSGTGLHAQDLDIRLQGIMQVDGAFHALINGRSVKAGDSISGVTIREISRHQVVVLTDRKEKIIYDIYQGRIDRGKK